MFWRENLKKTNKQKKHVKGKFAGVIFYFHPEESI